VPVPRYYVYVSDAKLDMLHGQIPRKLRDRIAKDLKLDLKLVSLSLTEVPTQENRYSKVAVVEDYLERDGGVGSVGAPGRYIRDTLDMTWGHADPRTAPDDAVYFAAETPEAFVLLGGSTKHLVGSGPAPAAAGASLGPLLMGGLRRGSPDAQDPGALIAEAVRGHVGAVERLEFLARRLSHGRAAPSDAGAKHVVLGTPLWVALAD
jgi:hypothetical protein